MAQSLHHRKRDTTRRRSRSLRLVPPRPAGGRRFPRGYSIVLLAMAYGSTIAVLVVAAGFTMLVRDGVSVTREASVALERAGQIDGDETTTHSKSAGRSSPVAIRIRARHLGNLMLGIRAKVTMNKPARALSQAKVVAFTDMVQMPGAHAQGPLPLQEVPASPGHYQTQVRLPMPGDYEVRIVVRDPVRGEETTTVPVGTTY